MLLLLYLAYLCNIPYSLSSLGCVLLNVLVTVKAAPHGCVIRTGLLYTRLKAENEVRCLFIV